MANPGILDHLDTGLSPDYVPATSRELLYPKSGLWYYMGHDGVEHVLQGVADTRNLIAGAGLVGGGTLAADRTFDVVAGDGGLYIAADALFTGQGQGGTVVGASRTYVAGDRGKTIMRSNSGSAMTDTMPTLTNTAADIGFTFKVHNLGAVVAETITFTAPGGATFFTGGATTYVLRYGCRQTFVWNGTAWVFDAGNSNLLRITTTPVVAGNMPSFGDIDGRVVGDSGVASQQAQATITGRKAAAGTGALQSMTPAEAKTVLAIVPADVTGFDTQVRTSTLNQMTAPTADLSINSHKLTAVSDGSVATDAATFGQLTAAIEGKKIKDPVACATTANIALSGEQTLDGFLTSASRVLVKNQTLPETNGLYLSAAGAWARTIDANTATEISNASVLVQNGTLSKGDIYTSNAVVTLGTDPVNWSQTGEGNTVYTADGSTLQLVGTTFSEKDGGTTNAKLADMVQGLFKGRQAAAGTGPPQDLTGAQAATILSSFFDAAGLAAAAQAASQPLDGDLTTIAGLTATTNNMLQSVAGAWASRTPTQVTSTLDVATQSLKGLMSAADKAGFDHDNVSLTNILDFAGDLTATTDNATPLANALAALPASGGVIGFPVGQYLLGSNFNPAGRSVRICGDSKAQSNIILTHATADGFTFNSGWFSGMENIQVTGLSTQTTGVLVGGEATVPVLELKNFPTAGSASFGGTAGWATISWTGKSAASGAGNLTGCSGVVAAASGVWVMIRTGGYAVRLESNYSNLQNFNCYAVFDGILLSSALGFLDTVEVRQVRNNATFIDGASADKFVNRLTTASSPLMEKSININLTSSLLLGQCQILNGKVGLDFNPPNGGTIPSVEAVNCFFDNCTIGMRVTATGTGSSYRSKFTNCWFSSAATAGVQFNTTQFDGFSFVNCDFYGNGKGIDAGIVGGGHWMIASSRMAQNTIAINLSGSAAHFPIIVNNEIGPTGAFGANTTGIVVTAGTYKGLIICNNAVVNNTTNATLGAVTVAAGEASFYRISDNAGINPLTGAAVTTPGVPTAGTTVTNTTGRRVSIFALNAATAPAAIVLNGVSTAQINKVATTGTNIVWLDPGGTIAFTTTTITSWTWVGQ